MKREIRRRKTKRESRRLKTNILSRTLVGKKIKTPDDHEGYVHGVLSSIGRKVTVVLKALPDDTDLLYMDTIYVEADQIDKIKII